MLFSLHSTLREILSRDKMGNVEILFRVDVGAASAISLPRVVLNKNLWFKPPREAYIHKKKRK